MELSFEDAKYVAKEITEYFSQFKRIDDYFRIRKLERLKSLPATLPGFGFETDMFQSFDMHPNEMNFEVVQLKDSVFDTMLDMTASFSPDVNPGKSQKFAVKETTTNTVVGFLRFGSPVLFAKPRHNYLGEKFDMVRFNKKAIMGFIIVPVQPFGYNYLGGKLMAAICTSHQVREFLNKKYDTEFCLFETTSLYGSIKGVSMYDGMKPYIRYKGDTESNLMLNLGDELYFRLRDWFIEKNGGEELVPKDASSRKMKIQNMITAITKRSLKKYDQSAYDEFHEFLRSTRDITTNKRWFISEYGFSNVKDVLLGKTDVLQKAENYDRFDLESIVTWWKKLAGKRYDKLVKEGNLRTELEVWTSNSINDIDIIR